MHGTAELGRPIRGRPAQDARESPGQDLGAITFNAITAGALRAGATFTAAVVIAGMFPATNVATSAQSTTQLTAEEAGLAAGVSVLLAAHPTAAEPVRLGGPQRADRSVRLATTTAAAVTTTVAKKQPKPPVKNPAPAKPALVKKTTPNAPAAVAVSDGSRVSIVVGFALAQVGKPYVWGAAGPGSYDCSGLTMVSFSKVGIRLPHQSGGQASAGRAVSRAQLQRGDLILYSGHVAIALGGGKMVHAANPRVGIVVASIYGNPIGYRRLL